MIDPQLIFQEPEKYLDYLTSRNPEGQYFDRKEVWNEPKKKIEEARENIKETVSSFTNSRGGILVLGIDNAGKIVGLNHLNENEFNSLVQTIFTRLTNHFVKTKEWNYNEVKLLLIYCPIGGTGICATNEAHPKAWARNGANNTPLTLEQQQRIVLERSKSFEQIAALDFDLSSINKDVLSIFKGRYLEEQGSTQAYNDFDFLKAIGAVRADNSKHILTNAGLLFFGNLPTAQIPQANIRILKYDCEYKDFETRGNPIFDRSYDGCLPVLLQKIRTFIKEAAFFKTYTYRDPNGSGIIDEPELPSQAVEEAIVNAIIHRDYSMPTPIECTLFKDAFVVRNPGKLQQADFIPTHFSLDKQSLQHYPRNPAIVNWAKTMRDESGQRFVKALSEGYRTMRDQMLGLGLPAPQYQTNGFTTVILFNNYLEREAKIKKMQQPLADEFTNLFEIDLQHNIVSEPDPNNRSISIILLNLIKDKLQNLNWFIDRDKSSRIVAHQKGKHIIIDSDIDKWIRVFPAYSFQVYRFEEKYYLSIDFDIQVKNVAALDKLAQKGISDLRFRKAQVKFGGAWTHGTIEDFTEYYARIYLPEFEKTENIKTSEIVPYLNKTELNSIAFLIKRGFNLDTKLKALSLSSVANASKQRLDKINETANYVASEIFPISYNGFTAFMKSLPTSLHAQLSEDERPFTVIHSLREPGVRFGDNAIETNILTGLAKFGSYSSPNKDLEIVPFCLTGFESKMASLIHAIQTGSMNFKGLERTFKMGVKYLHPISKESADDFLQECKRLLNEYSWEGNKELNKLFLIHIPEDVYPITDINSPYFTLKEFLLEKGIPVQMVDTPTLNDPKFKDFNLALNIVAKTGGTPWVLPAALPEADLFIGLSYAQYKNENLLYRTMGYANVFDRYGQWQFFKGNVASFDFEYKHLHLAKLVRETLEQRENLPDTANIHIHYSSKFSRIDREHILKSVREVRPNAIVNFVWINIGHNIRMFDSRIEGNGSLSRGTYVITRKNQFFLSTTGYNVIKKSLGTPIMLEINVHTEPYNPNQLLQYKTYAQHILSLTKLNWASTQTINGEPVTTKYAHDIARLSQVFYRRKGEFKLHPVLEKTPWFI
jgi:predicted HTH transcriptional regulator